MLLLPWRHGWQLLPVARHLQLLLQGEEQLLQELALLLGVLLQLALLHAPLLPALHALLLPALVLHALLLRVGQPLHPGPVPPQLLLPLLQHYQAPARRQ